MLVFFFNVGIFRLKSKSRAKGYRHHIWVGITGNSSHCDYPERTEGFCLVDGSPFRYGGKTWWSGAEPNDMPNSCAQVGGYGGTENLDVGCEKAINVDVLCEIDWRENHERIGRT